ncbi:MAG: YczE/YyaS/YitT family protein, partial [Candidatus Nanopelagicus sp.]
MTGANKFNNWLRRIQDLLRPSRSIPTTSWRAPSTWGLFSGNQRFQRLIILIFGLTIFGIGEAFLVITALGNSPWVVLSQGISLNSNLNIGQATFLVSFLVLILWIPLKQKPGFGTIANMVVIAAAIEFGLLIIPETTNLTIKYFYILLGIA